VADAEQTEKWYKEQMGEDALERQKRLADLHYKCCGALKSGPHHPTCKKARRRR